MTVKDLAKREPLEWMPEGAHGWGSGERREMEQEWREIRAPLSG